MSSFSLLAAMASVTSWSVAAECAGCAPGSALPQAPPEAPPIRAWAERAGSSRASVHSSGSVLYSIGDPTDEEQLHLEYLNRSRAAPAAEGTRLGETTDARVLAAYDYFGVDVALMESQFAAIPAVPPLAMNALLTAAARAHSLDMYRNNFQSHTGSNGSSTGERIAAQGYDLTVYGENVFAYAESVFQGYAGFNVDWGPGTGGMQTPPGHRLNIHSANFREIGVGVVLGTNGSVGPQLVTQDFATRRSATPLLTGVAYYDLNGNLFYDPGEGIGGVRVAVAGNPYYAITAASGGYAVPVPGDGSYTMTFSGSGFAATQRSVTVSGGENVKVDFTPAYVPPAVSGPVIASIQHGSIYSISTVAGATQYDWEQRHLRLLAGPEGGENGLTDFVASTTSGYGVLVTSPRASGSYGFHLAHPTPPCDQTLEYRRVLVPGSNGTVRFQSRLGTATTDQAATVQVSVDGGATWEEVYRQAGAGQPGETGFQLRTVSLAAFAGNPVQLRFNYAFVSGNYYPGTGSSTGWFFDDIQFAGVEELLQTQVSTVPSGNTFVFAPTVLGAYELRARAKLVRPTLDWGPTFRLAVADLPAVSVQILGGLAVRGTNAQFGFALTNGRSGLEFKVFRASRAEGPWQADDTATIQTLQADVQFRVTSSLSASGPTFFRVRAN